MRILLLYLLAILALTACAEDEEEEIPLCQCRSDQICVDLECRERPADYSPQPGGH